MREHKKLAYACLYASYISTFSTLSDAAVGKVIRALLEYMRTGEELPLKGSAYYVWPTIRDQYLRDRDAYDRRCEQNRRNAQKQPRQTDGEYPEEETEDAASGSDRCTSLAKSAKEKEKENEKEKEKENEKKKEKEKKEDTGEDIASAPPRPRFSKPSIEAIRAYCQEKGYALDPEAIWDFYEANGWKVGKSPMKDWKAAVRNWMRRETSHGRSKKPAACNEIIFRQGHNL